MTEKKTIFKRFCKRCGELYTTPARRSKTCEKCHKTKYQINRSLPGMSYWNEWKYKNSIKEEDLRRYRKNVKKKNK